MNFVERLFDNGFERVVPEIEQVKGRYDVRFNPNNGWNGVTIYHPYERFIKENKQVELSLEKFGVEETIFLNDTITKRKINEKHITVSIDGSIIYHNKFGVMPPEETIQQIIN